MDSENDERGSIKGNGMLAAIVPYWESKKNLISWLLAEE